YIDEWKKLGLTFDGIETGFLGSKEQIEIVIGFLNDFRIDSTVVVVDPIMGDHGKTYATYTRAMCEEMKRLICYADIITPNMTEACILADRTYQEEKWKIRQIRELAERLSEMGPKKVVITGIPQGEYIANYCYEKDGEAKLLRTLKVGTQRCGTGDIFASIITADAVNGVPFQASVRKASNFIKRCIQKSIELEIPVTDGVCFEEILRTLR
ncbi:MAG: PfkB family carbohydrate kinase, partial [Hungatella sp.]